jgi:hypothetical protein
MPEPHRSIVLNPYARVRRGMGLIALLLPLLLWLGGVLFFATPLQPSMSAYYFAHDNLRDILVGSLCAIGVLLFLYKGESHWEGILLNIAGICAVGIAFFEMKKGVDCIPHGMSVHGAFAVLFYLILFVVCLVDMRVFAEKGHQVRALPGSLRGTWYRIFAAAMLISMLGGAVYAFALPADIKLQLCGFNFTFWVETIGIWAFSGFWLLRTWELDKSEPWTPFAKSL